VKALGEFAFKRKLVTRGAAVREPVAEDEKVAGGYRLGGTATLLAQGAQRLGGDGQHAADTPQQHGMVQVRPRSAYDASTARATPPSSPVCSATSASGAAAPPVDPSSCESWLTRAANCRACLTFKAPG